MVIDGCKTQCQQLPMINNTPNYGHVNITNN